MNRDTAAERRGFKRFRDFYQEATARICYVCLKISGGGREEEASVGAQDYRTKTLLNVVLQKSIPTRFCQLIREISDSQG